MNYLKLKWLHLSTLLDMGSWSSCFSLFKLYVIISVLVLFSSLQSWWQTSKRLPPHLISHRKWVCVLYQHDLDNMWIYLITVCCYIYLVVSKPICTFQSTYTKPCICTCHGNSALLYNTKSSAISVRDP